MFYLILGDYRSGKTLRLVLEGYDDKREVWGNFDLDIKDYRKIGVMDLTDLGNNKLLLLDEMQTFLDSRSSMSHDNLFITNVLDSVDKRDVDIFGSVHLFSSVDIRFRQNVHRIIKCERIGKRKKEWGRLEDFRDFKYSTMNTYTGGINVKRLRYGKAIPYFELYKTQEKVKYPNQKDLELDLLLKHDPEKAYERLMEIAHKIIEKKPRITHPSVKVGLLQLGHTIKFESLIYSCIKDFTILKDKGGISKDTILKSNKEKLITEYPL